MYLPYLADVEMEPSTHAKQVVYVIQTIIDEVIRKDGQQQHRPVAARLTRAHYDTE